VDPSIKTLVGLFLLVVLSSSLAAAEFFSPYSSGDSVEVVLKKIQEDPLLIYRENQLTMAVPVVRDNEVFFEVDEKVRALAIQGNGGYLRQVFFHFTDEKLSSMTVIFSPQFTSYYEVFLKLRTRFKEPSLVRGPQLIEWESGGVLIRLERPITVKYSDSATIEELRQRHEQERQEDMNVKEAILDRL
jgi:hypothetical protein